MTTPTSIYADPVRSSVRRSRQARAAQQHRAACRLALVTEAGPERLTDRLTPTTEVLSAYRRGHDLPDGPKTPLSERIAHLDSEVRELEAWASSRPHSVQRSGPVIRQALDFLRHFGRLTTLDFSGVPVEERGHLVKLLALEHRWCYAAAGTTRDAFKAATGRTGAR